VSRPRELSQSVVVLTGASSGIGRAAAMAFARRGARLVLAARAEEPLAGVMKDCIALGAEALAVPTDVRDEPAVQALADRAVQRFGRIDTWVNDAGVIAYGRFEDVPSDVFRAVIETNLLGQVHGARAALRVFRRQGSGVLINLSSVWGRVTTPDVSAYVTSKFAVRAFSECVRHELRGAPGIDVATILPQAVDTPIFEQSGNYSGRSVRPVPPLFDPEEVAEGIVRCARSPKREVTYGRLGRALEVLYAFAPRLYCRVLPLAFRAGNFGSERAEPTAGNVVHPVPGGERIDGGWRAERRVELTRALRSAAGEGVRALFGRSRSG
jgi:NAD(P)-dependent dehydrogenase (short-subunit alcohol dehydrogenase family)